MVLYVVRSQQREGLMHCVAEQFWYYSVFPELCCMASAKQRAGIHQWQKVTHLAWLELALPSHANIFYNNVFLLGAAIRHYGASPGVKLNVIFTSSSGVHCGIVLSAVILLAVKSGSSVKCLGSGGRRLTVLKPNCRQGLSPQMSFS